MIVEVYDCLCVDIRLMKKGTSVVKPRLDTTHRKHLNNGK